MPSNSLNILNQLFQSQGIMMGHHISDTARVSILKELANRMQKQVMDVTSPWYVKILGLRIKNNH